MSKNTRVVFFIGPFDRLLYKSFASKNYIHPKNYSSATCVFQAKDFTLGGLGACRFASINLEFVSVKLSV